MRKIALGLAIGAVLGSVVHWLTVQVLRRYSWLEP